MFTHIPSPHLHTLCLLSPSLSPASTSVSVKCMPFFPCLCLSRLFSPTVAMETTCRKICLLCEIFECTNSQSFSFLGESTRPDRCPDDTHIVHKGRECDIHPGHYGRFGCPRRLCQGHLWTHVHLDCWQDQQGHLQTCNRPPALYWCSGHLWLWELWQKQVQMVWFMRTVNVIWIGVVSLE